MTLKVIATGFNSRLCKQLQHNGLVVDVELSRYCQTLITEPSVLIVFNDVPLSECDKFSEWISQLSKNINIEKIIFCSSFVCELGAVTTYAKRKLYLEKSLAARLDDRLVIFRLRNLVLIGGQWEQRLRHLKSRPVINLSKKNAYFHYYDITQVLHKFQSTISGQHGADIEFSTFDIANDSNIYIRFPVFKNPLSNTSLVLRIIQKLFFIVIISGTEYSFNENTI